MTMLDLRRQDLRTPFPWRHPFWITSAEIGIAADDLEAVVFSFPAAYGDKLIIIHEIGFELLTVFTAGTVTIDIGLGTIPLETSTTGATVTTTDADEYVPTADITLATPAMYWPDGGDWLTAAAAMTGAARFITPADADVPVILATIVSDDVLTAGAGRVHALISTVPLKA